MMNDNELLDSFVDEAEIADSKPTVTNTAAQDYAQTMFTDGNSRASRTGAAGEPGAYNRAVHAGGSVEGDVYDTPVLSASDTTFHSRDGSDAVGTLDEDGGSLGGTEEELDSLEAGGTPVDRNPRMKE